MRGTASAVAVGLMTAFACSSPDRNFGGAAAGSAGTLNESGEPATAGNGSGGSAKGGSENGGARAGADGTGGSGVGGNGTGGTDVGGASVGGTGSPGGEGGAPPVVGPAACVGQAMGYSFCDGQKVMKCSADGLQVTQTATCTGKACVKGACVGTCEPTTLHCVSNGVATCDAQGALGDAIDCPAATPQCAGAGVCSAPPSCMGLAKTCGPKGTDDCCASLEVPGGTFNRRNDAAYPATLADFRLDKYEITVGRFRKFVTAFKNNIIAAKLGKNPNNPLDMGWDATWNAKLPASSAALATALKCDATHQSWTDAAGTNESVPINCMNWYEAEAFCIWDGGRLPTEAEWNYAAAGGSEQRAYPWGAADVTCAYANGKAASNFTEYCVKPGTGYVNQVGSESPKGDGKWGQVDLSGNVWEWVQDDYTGAGDYPVTCNNCAILGGSTNKAARGGSYAATSLDTTSIRDNSDTYHEPGNGLRCARAK